MRIKKPKTQYKSFRWNGLWWRGCELSGFKACKKKRIGPVMKLGKQLSSIISVKNLWSPWNYFSLMGAFIREGGEINE